jgi:hypothetical protein
MDALKSTVDVEEIDVGLAVLSCRMLQYSALDGRVSYSSEYFRLAVGRCRWIYRRIRNNVVRRC